MEETSFLEELQKIYADVSEWLKFAEAKHAGLFAVWTALLIALITNDEYLDLCICVRIAIVIPVIAGIVLCIIAFVPFLNHISYFKKRCMKKYGSPISKNIVFYQNIFVLTYDKNGDSDEQIKKYKIKLKEKFGRDVEGALVDDYIQQIIEVATVCTIKTYLFSVSAAYTFWICILAPIAFLIA